MFSNKELTIIVPIYNVEKYLRRCIEGLVAQYNGRYLVLLIDDGSTDCSSQIADEYAKKYDFILSFHKCNEGLSSARNFGLVKTTSKYVWFLDSDDYIYKDSIKKIFQAIDGPDFDLYCFGYTTIYSDRSKDFIPCHKIKKYSYVHFIKNYMKFNWSYAVWNKIYKFEIIKNHKIDFNNNNEIYSEDIYFNLTYLQYVFNIQFSDNKILNYRLRSDSLYGVSSRLNNLSRFFLLVKRLPLLTNNEKYKSYIALHLFRLDYLHYKRTRKIDYTSQISKKDRKIIKKLFLTYEYYFLIHPYIYLV